MSSSSAAPTAPSCLVYGLFALAIVWICALVGVGAPVAWFVREIVVVSGSDWPFWASPLIAAAQGLLILAPLAILIAFTRTPLLRATYRVWALACGCLLAYGLARGLPTGWSQAATLLQGVIGLLLALGLWLANRQPAPNRTTGWPWPALCVTLACAALLLLPWLVFGALGSLLDTGLALFAGAGVGLVAGLLFQHWLKIGPPTSVERASGSHDNRSAALGTNLQSFGPGLRHEGYTQDKSAIKQSTMSGIGFGGLVLGVSLLIIAAGAGFEASNLLLVAALPPLGFGAATLAQHFATQRRTWLAPAALVGAAATAALAGFDPDEITILLGGSDVPTQAFAAAGWAFAVALIMSALLWAAARLLPRLTLPVALGGLAASVVVAATLYSSAGHPGFYGEKLFVILGDQADLTAAPAIANREERLRFVYTSLTEHAATSQAGIRSGLERVGIGYTPYYLVNALEVDGGPLVRLWLGTRPEVARVLESQRLRPLPSPPPAEPGDEQAPTTPEWNITSIGADRVWQELGITGEGIVIGQSDSGVDGAHPALSAQYRGAAGDNAYNWLDPWYGASAPRDYGMHGTHTLGSIVGADGIGVAPGATWFACSNLARNLGNPARYLDCLQFMLAPYAPTADPFRAGDPARAAHVLNNSWGCPPIEGCDAQSLQPAVDALRAAGIFVVASAGNEGSACGSVRDPIAIYDSVFSVGAVDEAGNVTDFSSRGPVEVDGSGRTKPDIVAPGANILSAQPGGGYGRADGTSMAGPHVAGVVALVWSANPALVGDIDRTEQLILAATRPYSGEGGMSCAGGEASNVYGYGLLDAYAAVQAALAIP